MGVLDSRGPCELRTLSKVPIGPDRGRDGERDEERQKRKQEEKKKEKKRRPAAPFAREGARSFTRENDRIVIT